jgi:AcrR family transcriptional regulator
MEELILSKAGELFFCYGLKSVSMDDISRHAAISKKTIYRSFDDKTQLVERLVDDLLKGAKQHLEKCRSESENAIQQAVLITETPVQVVRNITPTFFFELEKFCPWGWKSIDEHNRHFLMPLIAENLRRGIKEEFYRPEIDIPFITQLRSQQLLSVPDTKNYGHKLVESGKLMMQLTEFYLHAIATSKGKKLIGKYLNEYNERQFSNRNN